MDFDRRGESLWYEWEGFGYTSDILGSLIYCTVGHVGLGDHVVFNALSSAVQRDGVAESIGRASSAIQPYTAKHGYAGEIDGGLESHVCNLDGETFYGETVDEVIPMTWVEVVQP